jgi:phosphonate transport system substrate-binding protein
MILKTRSAALMVVLVALSALVGSSALADWREDVRVLRIGVLAGSGASYTLATMEPFRSHLEFRLGIPVELVPASSYSALIDAQVSARVDYAIHSAASYVTTAATCTCVEPLVVPASADGAIGFYAILIVRAGSPIRQLVDARGARLAVSSADSIAGRLVPLKALTREGIDVDTYFSAMVETTDPATAITTLFTDEADVAVGWSSLTGDAASGYDFGVLNRMVGNRTLSMDEIRVVWQSPLIPFGPHAVRTSLPADLKALLAETLTEMGGLAPAALDAVDRRSIGGGGFVAVDAAAYAVIEDLVTPDRGN